MSDEKQSQAEYRVLARKYRPQSFAELIGQDALVRTLTNAIDSGRVAHAFMLTGVRGVGKTTTARIIAKALNYRGADGTADASVGDTSDCALCQAISEDRHPDVIEMDAATHTGVDDMREILDGVRYAPTEARYKIYIIDEVHMLSKQAFNALLKTLEEPPAHVKFIFATTEIRKVPITVLSRCQRFDLRRVDVPTLSAHFAGICEKEGVKADEAALAMISRAADGSVRDGLSILDQAMALSDEITAQGVQDMLGLADRAATLDLLDHMLGGRVAEALGVLDGLVQVGGDPAVILADVLDFVHILTRFRSVPDMAKDGAADMGPDMIERLAAMAAQLSMPSLSKAWQILLKGLEEVQRAPDTRAAAEMVVMRMVYASDLPDPKDLIKQMQDGGGSVSANNGQLSASASGGSDPAASVVVSASARVAAEPQGGGVQASAGGGEPRAALAVVPDAAPEAVRVISTLEDVHAVVADAGEIILASEIYNYVEPVRVSEGVLEIAVREGAAATKIKGLQKVLSAATGANWMVSFVPATGAATLAELGRAAKEELFNNVLAMPIMKDVMNAFPDAELVDVIDETKGE